MAHGDGGPAFPVPENKYGDPVHPGGMSLRDWFAGQALTGWISEGSNLRGHEAAIAEGCYVLADAMLQARIIPDTGDSDA